MVNTTAPYDLDLLANSTSIDTVIIATNEWSGGFFVILLFIVAPAIIFLMANQKQDFQSSVVVATFLSAVSSIILFGIGLVSWQVVLVPISLTALVLIWYKMQA